MFIAEICESSLNTKAELRLKSLKVLVDSSFYFSTFLGRFLWDEPLRCTGLRNTCFGEADLEYCFSLGGFEKR